MKFNVGDRIVLNNFADFLGNPYHYQKCRMAFHTVTKANENKFTIHKTNKELSEITAGTDLYMLYQQDTGTCFLYNSPKALHIEKDREIIDQMLNGTVTKRVAKHDKELSRRLAYLDEQIATYQAQRNDLLTNGCSRLKGDGRQLDLIEENKQLILSLINGD